jgi:hypothetical protein
MDMAFKTQPIGSAIASMGIDWTDVANRVANEIGASEYRLSYLYGSSRPTNALNPLAAQRVAFAFEKLGTGGVLPVLSFFGTPKTWTDTAEAIIRVLGYEPSDDWASVLDENDNPIRVVAHNGSKLCFAVNVYGPTRSDLESRSTETAEADTDEASDGDGDNGNADGDMELDFGD